MIYSREFYRVCLHLECAKYIVRWSLTIMVIAVGPRDLGGEGPQYAGVPEYVGEYTPVTNRGYM